MSRLELDKWDLKRLYDLWKKGRLNLQPDYQRGKVWCSRSRSLTVSSLISVSAYAA